MKKYLLILTINLTIICVSSNSNAEYRITDLDKADITRVEVYLNGLKSLRSKFVQLSSDGSFAEGNIYIERPNRMRLDYTQPPNIQVYADRFWLTHVDTELGSVSRIPLKLTPASTVKSALTRPKPLRLPARHAQLQDTLLQQARSAA